MNSGEGVLVLDEVDVRDEVDVPEREDVEVAANLKTCGLKTFAPK